MVKSVVFSSKYSVVPCGNHAHPAYVHEYAFGKHLAVYLITLKCFILCDAHYVAALFPEKRLA